MGRTADRQCAFAFLERGERSMASEGALTGGAAPASAQHSERIRILQVIQPGLLGLMDGSVSTLAPLFATAALAGRAHAAFLVGLAASAGAAISMGLAEALSD